MGAGAFRSWVVGSFLVGGIAGATITLAGLAAGWFDPPTPPQPNSEWGRFLSAPQVTLLPDGRELKLNEDFVYVDPRKRVWVARKGSVVNGASIPKSFWSVVGGPLEGPYRDASIVHDEGCRLMSDQWEDVHLMFYEACRCSGLPENKAKVMYAAVYHFGPRWEIKQAFETKILAGKKDKGFRIRVQRDTREPTRTVGEPTGETRSKLEALINSRNPSLEELEKIDPKAL